MRLETSLATTIYSVDDIPMILVYSVDSTSIDDCAIITFDTTTESTLSDDFCADEEQSGTFILITIYRYVHIDNDIHGTYLIKILNCNNDDIRSIRMMIVLYYIL